MKRAASNVDLEAKMNIVLDRGELAALGKQLYATSLCLWDICHIPCHMFRMVMWRVLCPAVFC